MVSQAERLKLKVPTPQPRISPTGAAAQPGGLLGPAGVQNPDTRPGGLLGPSSAPPNTSAPRTITVTPSNPLQNSQLAGTARTTPQGRAAPNAKPPTGLGAALKTPLPAGSRIEGIYRTPPSVPATGLGAGFTNPQFTDVSKIALPSYTERNQSVASHLDKMLRSDSPYLTRARLSGQQMAASRGLLNSSAAAGAAEGAAIDRAFQVASQDAAQNFQMNLSNQNFRQEAALQLRDIASKYSMAGADINSREAIAAAQIAAEKEMQGIQLEFEERKYLDEIKAQFGLQANDIAASMNELQARIDADFGIEGMRQDFQRGENVLDRQLQSRGLDIQQSDLDFRREDSAADREFRAGENVLDRALRRFEAELDTDTRVALQEMQDQTQRDIAQWNIAENQRDKFAENIVRIDGNTAAALNGIMANNNLKAADRNALITDLMERSRNEKINMATIYSVGYDGDGADVDGAARDWSQIYGSPAPQQDAAQPSARPPGGVGVDAAATASALDAGSPPPAFYTEQQKAEWVFMQNNPSYLPVLLDLNGRPLTARELAAQTRREDGGYDGDGRGNSGPGGGSSGPTGGESGLGGARGGDDGDGTRG